MILTVAAAAAAMLAQGPYGGPQGDAYGRAGQLPGGSYTRSCQDARVSQGRLFATCADRSRRLRPTSIPLARCAGYPIENIDGRLQCGPVRGDFEDERRGPDDRFGEGRRPGGGFGRSGRIVVYEDSEYRGRSAAFDGPVADLRASGFNDRITSFRVQGVWQVCTDANFSGRCVVYDYDESNVSTNRINDQISSMRPVGR